MPWAIVDTVEQSRRLAEGQVREFFGWLTPQLTAARFKARTEILLRLSGATRGSVEAAVRRAKAGGAVHVFLVFHRWDGPIFGWKKDLEITENMSLQGILQKTIVTRFGTLGATSKASVASAVASFDQKTPGNHLRNLRRHQGLVGEVSAPQIVRERSDFAPDRSVAILSQGLEIRWACLAAMEAGGPPPEKVGKLSSIRLLLQLPTKDQADRFVSQYAVRGRLMAGKTVRVLRL